MAGPAYSPSARIVDPPRTTGSPPAHILRRPVHDEMDVDFPAKILHKLCHWCPSGIINRQAGEFPFSQLSRT